jgi:hypothetical protein
MMKDKNCLFLTTTCEYEFLIKIHGTPETLWRHTGCVTLTYNRFAQDNALLHVQGRLYSEFFMLARTLAEESGAPPLKSGRPTTHMFASRLLCLENTLYIRDSPSVRNYTISLPMQIVNIANTDC